MKSVIRWMLRAAFNPPRCIYEKDDTVSVITAPNYQVYYRTNFEFTVKNGATLTGSIWRDHDEPNPNACIIFLHSLGTNQFEVLNIIPLLCSKQLCIAAFDFPGCGMSGGEILPLDGSGADMVKCCVDKLRNEFGISKFGLWGRSMGAAIALQTVSIYNEDFQCIVSDSAFSCTEKVLFDQGKANGFPSFMISMIMPMIKKEAENDFHTNVDNPFPIGCVSDARAPLLMGHGKQDTFVPIQHAELLFQKYGMNNKQLYFFGGKHNSPRPGQWYQTAARFINRHMGIESAPRVYDMVFRLSQLHIGPVNEVLPEVLRINESKIQHEQEIKNQLNQQDALARNLQQSNHQTPKTAESAQSQDSESSDSDTNSVDSLKAYNEKIEKEESNQQKVNNADQAQATDENAKKEKKKDKKKKSKKDKKKDKKHKKDKKDKKHKKDKKASNADETTTSTTNVEPSSTTNTTETTTTGEPSTTTTTTTNPTEHTSTKHNEHSTNESPEKKHSRSSTPKNDKRPNAVGVCSAPITNLNISAHLKAKSEALLTDDDSSSSYSLSEEEKKEIPKESPLVKQKPRTRNRRSQTLNKCQSADIFTLGSRRKREDKTAATDNEDQNDETNSRRRKHHRSSSSHSARLIISQEGERHHHRERSGSVHSARGPGSARGRRRRHSFMAKTDGASFSDDNLDSEKGSKHHKHHHRRGSSHGDESITSTLEENSKLISNLDSDNTETQSTIIAEKEKKHETGLVSESD